MAGLVQYKELRIVNVVWLRCAERQPGSDPQNVLVYSYLTGGKSSPQPDGGFPRSEKFTKFV